MPSQTRTIGTGSTSGSPAWSNPGNITSENSVDATRSLSHAQVTGTLEGRTAGNPFSIPAGSSIKGIRLRLRKRVPSGDGQVKDTTVRLVIGGAAAGDNKAVAGDWGTAYINTTYGSASDLWGLATPPTVAQVNATDFGFNFQAESTGGTETAGVDVGEITIDYDEWTPAAEADQALGLGLAMGAPIAAETDSAIGAGISMGIEPALEADSAQHFLVSLPLAREADEAPGFGISMGIEPALEADEAREAPPAPLVLAIDPAIEEDEAVGLTILLGIIPAEENDQAPAAGFSEDAGAPEIVVLSRTEARALDAFGEVLNRSHRIATLAQVLDAGGNVLIDRLDFLDGQVILDATAAIRGRCELSLPGRPAYIPDSADHALAPYGNEIRICRGLRQPGGRIEVVQLGIFRIEANRVVDAGADLGIAISGMDHGKRIADARLEAPFQIPAGTNYADAILSLLQTGWAGFAHDFSTTPFTTPDLYFEEGEDPWQRGVDMARQIGMELYFDSQDVCRLDPIPTATNPVAELAEGEEGLLLAAERSRTREGSFNRVIVVGEQPDPDAPPPRGVATDDDPESPTYYFGPYGPVPNFVSTTLVASDAQAADAAAAQLTKNLGTTETVAFSATVDPRLAPGDPILIRRARAGIDDVHVVETLTIPLAAAGVMTGTTRAVRTAA